MGNQYFRFKQFTVNQEDCAMKVCTDACIQGAFTGQYIASHQLPASRILDIGAGTGLLSLMLAQQLPAAQFTAVELDTAAAGQALRNFEASPWCDRFSLQSCDVRTLSIQHPFDFIITNPPFYESALKSDNKLRNQAMHATTLNYADLLSVIDAHLAQSGFFSILLPYIPFTEDFTAQASTAGFFPQHILHVKQSNKHDYFRSIGIFSRQAGTPVISSLTIRAEGNEYTEEFKALLKAYYLYL